MSSEDYNLQQDLQDQSGGKPEGKLVIDNSNFNFPKDLESEGKIKITVSQEFEEDEDANLSEEELLEKYGEEGQGKPLKGF